MPKAGLRSDEHEREALAMVFDSLEQAFQFLEREEVELLHGKLERRDLGHTRDDLRLLGFVL